MKETAPPIEKMKDVDSRKPEPPRMIALEAYGQVYVREDVVEDLIVEAQEAIIGASGSADRLRGSCFGDDLTHEMAAEHTAMDARLDQRRRADERHRRATMDLVATGPRRRITEPTGTPPDVAEDE